jgi:hypothetical protein
MSVSPYSLGKLIDWKPALASKLLDCTSESTAPYSLGKLIDWKLDIKTNYAEI